jgi:ABC-2 type transport system permease protein
MFTAFPVLTVHRLGTPGDTRLGDPSILWGGLCFIAVSGLLHVAIGILCSCVTRSSALAALLAFISLLAMTAAGGAMESLPIESWEWLGWLREPAAHLRTFGHLQDFAAGILDSRPIVLYGTGTLLCLGLAVLSVEGQE